MQAHWDSIEQWRQPGYFYFLMAAMSGVLRNLMFVCAFGLSIAWVAGVDGIAVNNVVTLWLYPVGSQVAMRLCLCLAGREIEAAYGR